MINREMISTKNMVRVTILILLSLFIISTTFSQTHPSLFASEKDRPDILSKIKNENWAAAAWKNHLASIDKYVTRHQTDPQWIISRLAMYWKKGEHFTQCYLKDETWDYGVGNAPVPTVRMPGMRVWNEYTNVPLEDRIPYNETGDMKAISRKNPAAGVVIVPYRKSGHLIRGNNNEILTLAEKSAFAYWLTGEERYAKFASDIFNTWLIGTYYMNPILDPGKSSGGLGGFEPGGILGYYDYEQIHDDLQTHAAVIYDFLYDYLEARPSREIQATSKSYTDIASTVFKRFVDLGMVRGGKRGNWNINGWEMMMPSILVLEQNSNYKDGRGKEYYLQFYTTTSTRYHDALPDILKAYNPVTGLWSESPGYALNTLPSLMNMAMQLYKAAGINTISGNPMMQKAAMAVFPWMDARGNIVVFGDGRGGPGNFTVFERLLSYYTAENDTVNAAIVASALRKGIDGKQYDRGTADYKGLCLNVAQIPSAAKEIGYARTAYSPVHRHIVMKNGNDVDNGLMFTLYGGYTRGLHLSPNGLAMQLYGKGWALAPDASGYESYWSRDFGYHQTATGSNTILPGYKGGPIKINAMEPFVDSTEFTTSQAISDFVSFTDVSADEKRRLIAMVRTSATSGYYVDIFRSNQEDNDYLYHNLGNVLQIKDADGESLKLLPVDVLDTSYSAGYSFFKNPKKASVSSDINATWTISSVNPSINMDMWMKGEKGREVYSLDAPYTNLNDVVTPAKVNIAPDKTHAIIVRQNDKNAWNTPFVAVFEPYYANEKSVNKVSALVDSGSFTALLVESKPVNTELKGRKEYILNSLDDKSYSVGEEIHFSGGFGIASENQAGFRYLYLGSGTMLQNGAYKIEAEGIASATLQNQNGALIYSANVPVTLTVPYPDAFKGKRKNLKMLYRLDGKYIEAETELDHKRKLMKAKVPAGYNIQVINTSK